MSKHLKFRILELKKLHGVTFLSIATKCQVTERQVLNWANIPMNAGSSIPSDKLILLAEFFGVELMEMYTVKEIPEYSSMG